MYWTYALYSESADKIYIGQTNDLQRRIEEHNGFGEHKTWASRYKPWKLLLSENFPTRQEAMLREKQLKSYAGRMFLRNLINTNKGWSPPAGG